MILLLVLELSQLLYITNLIINSEIKKHSAKIFSNVLNIPLKVGKDIFNELSMKLKRCKKKDYYYIWVNFEK